MSRHPLPHSGSPSALGVPPLAELAELIHRSGPSNDQTNVVAVRALDDQVQVGYWPVPAHLPLPTEALIGWRPDPGILAFGLITPGQEHGDVRRGPVSVTVLTQVGGECATVVDRPGEDLMVLSEPPQGWGADAIRRTLALPTPPPDQAVSACVDATWLASVALAAHRGDGSLLDWPQVAVLHPLVCGLAPASPVLDHHDLAELTASMDRPAGWSSLLQQMTLALELAVPHPPGGRTIPYSAWFDQGSFSRWMLRRQPEVEDIVFEVLDVLTPQAGQHLLDALVSL